MNDLTVKSVNLMGDTVMAAQDEEGVIWAGVSYFCNALGMEKWQKDKQIQKAQSDKTLKKGCSKFGAGVFDPNNETVALRLDFIPMWLAKITITDRMEKDHPELAEKLLNYQLKAKDILADAFMQKQSMPQTTDGKIALLAQGHMELKEEVDSIKAEVDRLKNDLPILPVDADIIVKAAKKRGIEVMGGKTSKAYADAAIRQNVYSDMYWSLKRNFNVRSYKAIRRSDAGKAVDIIEQYTPPLFLGEKIEQANGKGGGR